MKEVILYGAGKRGKRYARELSAYGIEIAGFCDSFKRGNVIYNEMSGDVKEKTVYNLEDIDGDRYIIVISIADQGQIAEVSQAITRYGIVTMTLEEVLLQRENIVSGNRQYIADYHINEMDTYYKIAEQKENIDIFWGSDSRFNQLFKKLDLKRVVELACGHGRHVPHYISDAETIILVDIVEKNISYCRERFVKESKIQYYVNNGYDLSELESESCTGLFTYDAMVHFEMLDIFQYLKETKRILVRGGKALFHHSNNTMDYKVTFSTGKQGRNYMSKQLFAYLANRAGLTVIEQHEIDWGGEEKLDCITLVGNF